MYIEDYSKYIGEVKEYTIADEEEMKFIGISDIDLLSENIFTIENDFEDMAIINGNGKMFYIIIQMKKEHLQIYFTEIIIVHLDTILKILGLLKYQSKNGLNLMRRVLIKILL